LEIGYIHFTGFEESGVCWYCGSELKGRQRRWCSEVCRDAYWGTWNWLFASKACAQRNNHTCENCHRKESHKYGEEQVSLEIHHIIPIGGEDRSWHKLNERENLLCLCHECHKEIHKIMRPPKMGYKPPDSWEEARKAGQEVMELKV